MNAQTKLAADMISLFIVAERARGEVQTAREIRVFLSALVDGLPNLEGADVEQAARHIEETMGFHSGWK